MYYVFFLPCFERSKLELLHYLVILEITLAQIITNDLHVSALLTRMHGKTLNLIVFMTSVSLKIPVAVSNIYSEPQKIQLADFIMLKPSVWHVAVNTPQLKPRTCVNKVDPILYRYTTPQTAMN